MSAVVTGASGGLGLALVDALRRSGRTVVALGRREPTDPRLLAEGVDYRRVDLTDPLAAEAAIPEGSGTVFHCAAMTGIWGRISEFRRHNVTLTRNVLNSARTADVRTFVHVSSPSIYAAMHDRIGITENDAPTEPPLGPYARTKLESERLVLETDGRMRTVAIRPRGIVGPDDAVILPRLRQMAGAGRIPLVRGGHALVEFVDVRDVVSALLAAESRIDEVHGHAINISSGSPAEVREVARRLCEAMGIRPRFVDVPIAVARAVATLTDALRPRYAAFPEPRITRYALATLAYSQTFHLSKARRMLQWNPRHDALATLVGLAGDRP